MMDPVRNPYSPGAGNRPPALVGRDSQLEAFDVAVQRLLLGRHARSMMLTGLRGVGKTVLLREFSDIAKRHHWIHLHLEAADTTDFPAAIANLARRSLLRLSVGRRATEPVRQAAGVLKSFQLRWKLPDGGGDLTVGVEPARGYADSGSMEDDLPALLEAVATVAKNNHMGVLFTIDEIQYLERDDLAALIVALHHISQEQLPLLVAAAGLPSIPSLSGEAKSYAERLFDFVTIDSLADDAAAQAITAPAHEEGVTWDPEAVDLMVEATAGYPYFVQEFAKQAWDIATADHIDVDTVADAIPLAIAELDAGFFRVRIDRAPDSERAYLQAMASLGHGPYRSGSVAKAMHRTTTQLGPVRDSLIKRGLCYAPRHGVIDFTVPKFDDFIRRWMT